MTISKTNFIMISVTMIAILILFQFSNLSAIYTSEAMQNKNADQNVMITKEQTIQKEDLQQDSTYTTAVIGKFTYKEANIAEEWCLYTKRTYHRFDTLEDFMNNASNRCKVLIIGSDCIKTGNDVDILERLTKAGIHIILTSLPGTGFINSSEKFRNLIGIHNLYQENFRLDGITLYEGFLLGGKTHYKKFHDRIPYFRLKSGTKTYVTGRIKKQKKKGIKNEDLPPVIWRNQVENGFVFVVNYDFFEDHTGLGILSAMFSETQEYYIYPVVNAQNVVCQNFPYLSNENSKEISAQYYHSSKSFLETVVWPDVVSILNATGDKFSGMLAPKLEYSDSTQNVHENSISFYFKQCEKITGELGLSGDQMDSYFYYDKKIKYDSEIMKELTPDYIFTVFSPGNMPQAVYDDYLGNKENLSILSHINTLVTQKEQSQKPILSFYNNEIIAMANTIDGFSHSDEEDLYLRSIETALGYSSASLDFTRVLYPESKKDDWTKLSKNLSRYLETYWKEFRKGFSQVTVSQTAERIRKFFALDYNSYRREHMINLSITNFKGEASFLLNLNHERVVSVTGASCIEMERGRYLIVASDENVSIEVTDDAIED